jgi:methyltransferase
MSSFSLYAFFVCFVVIQRLAELRLSKKNEMWILSQGGHEIKDPIFLPMKILHTLWPISCIVEAYWRENSIHWGLTLFFLLLFFAGQALRLIAIRTLGKRWSVKIMVLPNQPPVTGGIFKYLRHPNYLGVILEIFSLPLMFGGWITAIVFSLANGYVLFKRISREESSLSDENHYFDSFSNKNRFIPKV